MQNKTELMLVKNQIPYNEKAKKLSIDLKMKCLITEDEKDLNARPPSLSERDKRERQI